ncbi:MAG: alpha-amylase [Planctomycetes bacterium]|nr:alpha-amylase [Planctomycetota bacterium]
MSESKRRAILARMDDRFHRLYGDAAANCLRRLKLLMGQYEDRIDASNDKPRWTAADNVLITYGDSIRAADEKPLATLESFLADHLAGVIDTVHILPFFPWSSDDGFSVIDYRQVDPALGKWKDVAHLNERFGLMFDLVLNHCSRRGEWFRDYLTGIAPARYYFHEIAPGTDLSQVTRPRPSPLLTMVRTRSGERWVWTTFSADQVDLNFANPDVILEFLDILMLYIASGARIIRLDAIAYLWKKIGTSCIHLPQTHEVVKLMRDLVDLIAPRVILLTETNVPHAENVSYFGEGDEAHMVYNFSLPPLLLYALSKGDGTALTKWAKELAPPPSGCTFLNFTASHDGIGVRPLEGLLPPEEIRALCDRVRSLGGHVSEKSNPDGSTSPYEMNITYFSALGPTDASEKPGLHVKRFLCSQTIALALRGVPAAYIHSLTATQNDYANVEQLGYPRAINRHKWDRASLEARLAEKSTATHEVFTEYRRLLKVRAKQAALGPDVPQHVLDLGPRVFAVQRTTPDGAQSLLSISNLTGKRMTVDLPADSPKYADDLLDDRKGPIKLDPVTLAPYQTRWLTT